jgi:hypothetical protein
VANERLKFLIGCLSQQRHEVFIILDERQRADTGLN